MISASVLALAAFLISSPITETAAHSVLLGVDANPPPSVGFDAQTKRDFFKMTVDAGVTHTYIHPSWNSLEPQQNNYDFSDIDFHAQLAEENNVPISLNVRLIDTMIRSLPNSYSALAFDDPRMTQALINMLRAMAPHLRGRVRWIALGNEVDNYLIAHQAEIVPYSNLIASVLPVVRELFPGVQVSVNFTNNAAPLLNNLFSPITALVDVFSYTYYPLNADFTLRNPSVAGQEIAQMVLVAGNKPVLFQEIGYASSPILNSSEQSQATFLQNVFAALRLYAGKIVAANFVWLSDLPQSMVDQLTAYYGQSNPNFPQFLATLGYWDRTGRPKPAWAVFKQYAPSLHLLLDRPGASLVSNGASSQPLSVGFAPLYADSGSASLAGLAILSLRQNGVTVAEASVPAGPSVLSGRIYAEVNGTVKTALAMANTTDQDAVVNFYFTDANGNSTTQGSFVIPAFNQIARFLDQSPFNLASGVKGTLTFSSSAPVASLALRGRTNERSEFVFSTVQISDFSSSAEARTIPHFADSGGWATEVILVNPTNVALDGTLQFLDAGNTNRAGQALAVSTTRSTASQFPYHISPNSFWSLKTMNTGASTVTGSIRVLPATGSSAPSGFAVLSFRSRGVTVSEASVYAIPPSSAFRLFVESSDKQSIQTGIAVANGSTAPAAVQVELLNLDGSQTGRSAVVTVPGNGQISAFVGEIPGLTPGVPLEGGLLRVSSTSSLISVIGLRGRYNERADFLVSTVFPLDEAQSVSSNAVFPHIADGGGFTTQFVLYNPTSVNFFSGNLQFFSQSGKAFDIGLRPTSSDR